MSIYYLMVKTHTTTGLKYLCQTKGKNPFKYLGSGKYWRIHLAKHGPNIVTEIIRECQTKEELGYWGVYYSNIWDIVNSNDWANLRIENGSGGAMPPIIAQQIQKTRIKNNNEASNPVIIEKQLATKRANGTLNPTTPESIKQGILTKKSRNNHLSRPESIAKQLATKKLNGTLNITTTEVIEKQLATKRANGTLNATTLESIKQGIETRRKNGTINPNKICVTCVYCQVSTGKPHFAKYHGNNCKHKP